LALAREVSEKPTAIPYDEIKFIREGQGVWKVNGKTFEGSVGESLSSRLARSTASRRLVIHHFIQENL
jgi:hypothetical protein